jgi:hypothetical protein
VLPVLEAVDNAATSETDTSYPPLQHATQVHASTRSAQLGFVECLRNAEVPFAEVPFAEVP